MPLPACTIRTSKIHTRMQVCIKGFCSEWTRQGSDDRGQSRELRIADVKTLDDFYGFNGFNDLNDLTSRPFD